jgi:EF hand
VSDNDTAVVDSLKALDAKRRLEKQTYPMQVASKRKAARRAASQFKPGDRGITPLRAKTGERFVTHNDRSRHEHRHRVTSDGRTQCLCAIRSNWRRRPWPSVNKRRPVTSGPDIWDANHDGIYTCDEWKSYLDRLFTLADRNRDGHLDPSEFSIIRRAGTAWADADFGYFDENQDGKITRSEFVTSRVRLFCSSTRTVTAASRRTK